MGNFDCQYNGPDNGGKRNLCNGKGIDKMNNDKNVPKSNELIPDNYWIPGYLFNKLLEENCNNVERYVDDLDMMYEYFKRNGFRLPNC